MGAIPFVIEPQELFDCYFSENCTGNSESTMALLQSVGFCERIENRKKISGVSTHPVALVCQLRLNRPVK